MKYIFKFFVMLMLIFPIHNYAYGYFGDDNIYTMDMRGQTMCSDYLLSVNDSKLNEILISDAITVSLNTFFNVSDKEDLTKLVISFRGNGYLDKLNNQVFSKCYDIVYNNYRDEYISVIYYRFMAEYAKI